MIKKPITIQIANGLEARPVALLVQVASQYESDIYVECAEKTGQCKEHYGNDDPRLKLRRGYPCDSQWRG